MRLNIFIIFLILQSCTPLNKKHEEIAVFAAIYERIPKFIPAPPLTKQNDSIEINPKGKNRKGIEHNYAINQNYYNGKFEFSISNVFYNTNKKFEKEKLDSVSWVLAQEVAKSNGLNGTIDSVAFNRILNTKIHYLNSKKLNSDDEKPYNVNRVLSFSHVAFNDTFTQAAVVVTNYGDKLDATAVIYILAKIDSVWKVTHIEVLTEIT